MNQISQPSRYRVVVRGRLGSSFASAFDEFELESHKGETSLTGSARCRKFGSTSRGSQAARRLSRHPRALRLRH
jgi:hypothetical protein